MRTTDHRGFCTGTALFLAVIAGCQSSSTPARESPTLVEVEALGVYNARMPMPGVLTAGQLTLEQFDELAKLGFKDMINLRVPTEDGTGWEEARAETVGVRYVNIPVDGAEGINEANAKALADALAEARGAPTVVYCGSSNRVGALLAAKAFWIDGKSAAEAMQLAKDAGVTRLEPKVKELVGQ